MNAKEMVEQMTLSEKAALLMGEDDWHVRNCPRLGAPMTMVSDGPHGLRKQTDQTDNLGINGSIKAVCFPSAAGLASSFDRNVLARLGTTLARECLAEDVSIVLGPAVNIKRSPLCGRNFEYFSEDPYLTGELAATYVKSVQARGVGTSVKHFAANNQEGRRAVISSEADERTLREIYLAAFETIVKQAQPWTVMCSYNQLNGTFASQNAWLLDQVLRKDWGFQGYVMTDWGAASDRVAGVAAGCELEMPNSGTRNTQRILDAVRDGKLTQEQIDRAAERILTISLRSLESRRTDVVFDHDADHETAREIAAQSMVLLKNENGLLPLRAGQKIAFIGRFAQKPRYQGGGSSHINPHRVSGALEAARKLTEIAYAPGYADDPDQTNEALLHEAVETARQAEVAVVFAGLSDRAESEGYDRAGLDLSDAQNRLIEAVAAVNPHTVVVLHNGAPVAMPWLASVGAVLEAYLGGEACGEAVCDLLFGDKNPSGKLAETFPNKLEDVPCARYFPGNPRTVEYREGIYVGYRYYDKTGCDVLFPFGHGLSYTQFAYEDLAIDRETYDGEGDVSVSFTIRNVGNRDGAEAAQVYVASPQDGVFRPIRELRGFEKVFLKAGEEKRVTVTLSARAFAYYHTPAQQWAVENGTYSIEVGASSRDLRLCGTVTVAGRPALSPAYAAGSLPTYESGRVQTVPDEEFAALLGRPIAPAFWPAGTRFTSEHCLDDAKDTKWGKRMMALLAKLAGDRFRDLLVAAYQAPIRSVSGMMPEENVDALVNLLNNEHTASSLYTLIRWGASMAKNRKK